MLMEVNWSNSDVRYDYYDYDYDYDYDYYYEQAFLSCTWLMVQQLYKNYIVNYVVEYNTLVLSLFITYKAE